MANLRVTPAVVSVANGAVVGEVQTRFALNFRRIRDRIFRVVRVCWRGHFSRGARDCGLESTWLRSRAETVVQNVDRRRDEQAQRNDQEEEKNRPAFHHEEFTPS